MSRQAAVLGRPVAHSLSPVLHRAAYVALGLDWSYTAVDCGTAELPALLAAAAPTVVGYSATMPLKRVLLEVADECSPRAAAIGAGNTLLRTPTGWRADNTDWVGIAHALAEADAAVPDRTVLLLGAGGTAQAALAALTDAGRITALVREPARAAELLATADRLGLTVTIGRLGDTATVRDADLVIATLPAGVADGYADVGWRAGQTVLDAIYHPWPTVLATAAGAAGAGVVSGASMLLHQAARQVELMTGSAAPVAAMRAALRAAAPGRGV